MLLTAADDIPVGKDWTYETKYDGFRCILEWEDAPSLISRNGKILNDSFPEIIQFCEEIQELVRPYLPLKLDGEVVHLVNNFKSKFSVVQLRGRMRNEDIIQKHVQQFPCHLIVFDLLRLNGEKLQEESLNERQKQLAKLFKKIKLPLSVNFQDPKRIQAIDSFKDSKKLWQLVQSNNGEGIIAKKKMSKWEAGKRTTQWLKIKNWKLIKLLVHKYDKNNNYFHGGIFRQKEFVEIVNFSHGLKEEELRTLIQLFQSKGTKTTENVWELEPSICVVIACIDFDGKSLREPRFHGFDFQVNPDDCHWQNMHRQLNPIPEIVQITHPDKPVWPALDLTKDDYLLYLQHVSPYMFPFLQNRQLTLIRFPHGVPGESFYQKSFPDKLPAYIGTVEAEDNHYVMCNDIETLLWLGNQLAIEYHVPFQPIHLTKPTEIVFDLDPPSVKEFTLAVEAAVRMKAIFDHFELVSYVKTSGGKGIQVYLPLPVDQFTYDETRIFTKFVCDFLCEQEPKWFTTERLKKNRQNKLYLDYVQHHEGKTIIAPYSPRGNNYGLIATPLEWHEVTSNLTPDQFTIPAVLERITKVGNPFQQFRSSAEKQKFQQVLAQIKDS